MRTILELGFNPLEGINEDILIPEYIFLYTTKELMQKHKDKKILLFSKTYTHGKKIVYFEFSEINDKLEEISKIKLTQEELFYAFVEKEYLFPDICIIDGCFGLFFRCAHVTEEKFLDKKLPYEIDSLKITKEESSKVKVFDLGSAYNDFADKQNLPEGPKSTVFKEIVMSIYKNKKYRKKIEKK